MGRNDRLIPNIVETRKNWNSRLARVEEPRQIELGTKFAQVARKPITFLKKYSRRGGIACLFGDKTSEKKRTNITQVMCLYIMYIAI